MLSRFIQSFVGIVFLSVAFSASAYASSCDDGETEELWSCNGYCFMGGDTPTNPWLPVSSTGSSEQEARDNIDCGQFVEVGITCQKVSYCAKGK